MATVDIEIKDSDVLEKVKEEVSRVAASAYDGDGQSLYESIMVYSRDADDLKRLFKDALSRLTERSRDILVGQTEGLVGKFYCVEMSFSEGNVPYYFEDGPTVNTAFKNKDGETYPDRVAVTSESPYPPMLFNITFYEDNTSIATGEFSEGTGKVDVNYPRKFKYNLPDFNTSLLPMVNADVMRFLVQHITAQWLVGKRYQRAEEFVAHANVVLEETIHHMKIRKPVNQRIGL